MASSLISQIAEDFAEQKALSARAPGVDFELQRELWKGSALEVLAFALPRLGIEEPAEAEGS